jgi:arylsulfatase A-like enzyme
VDYLQHDLIDKAIKDHQAGKVTRREFLQRLAIIGGGSALGLTLLGGLACDSSAAQPQTQLTEPTAILASPDTPNILLIVIDTLRSDHLSSYGYERSTSPTIDSLAEQGVLFENTFSTSPYTAPSHASLLTGRYPREHGAQWITRRPILDDRYPTLPQALKARGYRTAAFSANRFWFTREQGLGRGFIHFEDNFHSPGDMAVRTFYGRKFEEFILRRLFEDYPWRQQARDINNSVVHWLQRDPDIPFFAFLNYFDAHDPYFPPQPYRSEFSALENPGGIVNSYQNRYSPKLTPQELQNEIDAYDGAISYVDDHIAQLLAEIRRLGLGDNVLVIITSDHGKPLGSTVLLPTPTRYIGKRSRCP